MVVEEWLADANVLDATLYSNVLGYEKQRIQQLWISGLKKSIDEDTCTSHINSPKVILIESAQSIQPKPLRYVNRMFAT